MAPLSHYIPVPLLSTHAFAVTEVQAASKQIEWPADAALVESLGGHGMNLAPFSGSPKSTQCRFPRLQPTSVDPYSTRVQYCIPFETTLSIDPIDPIYQGLLVYFL